MKKLALLIAALFLLAIGFESCSKDDLPPMAYHSYQGTFQRLVNGKGPVAQVNITFTNGKWIGQSDTMYYPALSQGKYRIMGGRIYFQCETPWTAQFDWSLILNNHYEFRNNGNVIVISRDYPNGMKDIYRLTRQ